MHLAETIEDARGDAVEHVYACSESCSREWARSRGFAYRGWNGCQEGGDSPEWCAVCGVRCGLGSEGCDATTCLPTLVALVAGWPKEWAQECPHGLRFCIPPEGA